MGIVQKWLAWIASLGALYLVTAKPDAIYKGAVAAERLTAGSVVDVTTGGKGLRPA